MRRIRRRLEKAIRLNRNNSLSHRKLPLALETLESRLLLSTDLPGMHLVDPQVDYFDGQVVYLDFDGEQDVTYDGPVTIDGISVPAFSIASAELAGQEEAIIADVIENLNQIFADSSVVFTAEKPDGDMPYSTVFIGGDDSAFSEYGSFKGIAEQIDVGNQSLNDNAYVFSDGFLNNSEDTMGLATELTDIIAHETGHLLGYAHNYEDLDSNILSSVAGGTVTTEIYSCPSQVDPGELVNVQVRVMFSGDDNDGPWQVTDLDLYDDDWVLDDAIVCKDNPFKIYTQGIWNYYTFYNVNLSAKDDSADGNGIELKAWAEVNDNDWNGYNPDDYSPIETVTVDYPSLSVSTSSLNFYSSSTSKTFSVENSGGGTLTYSIGDDKSWISANPTLGSSTGEWDTITVTVSRSGLSPDDYSGTITVDPSEGSNQYVDVYMTIPDPDPVASRVSPGSPITLAYGTNQGFTVRGTDAGGDLWKVEWVLSGPESDSDTDNILFGGSNDTADFTDWGGYTFDKEGDYTLRATVYDDSGDTDSVSWSIKVNPKPEVTGLSWRSGTSSDSSIVTSRNDGQAVYLRADATGMNGQTITVKIYEEEDIGLDIFDDEITTKSITIGSSGYGTTSWTSQLSPYDNSLPTQTFYIDYDTPSGSTDRESARMAIVPQSFTIDNIFFSDLNDLDGDGYHSEATVRWDANVNFGDAIVTAKIYADEGTWGYEQHLGDVGPYTISGNSSGDSRSFAIPTTLLESNVGPTDDYQITIKLYVDGNKVKEEDSGWVKLEPPSYEIKKYTVDSISFTYPTDSDPDQDSYHSKATVNWDANVNFGDAIVTAKIYADEGTWGYEQHLGDVGPYTISGNSSGDSRSFAIPTTLLESNVGPTDDYQITIKLYVDGNKVKEEDSGWVKLEPPSKEEQEFYVDNIHFTDTVDADNDEYYGKATVHWDANVSFGSALITAQVWVDETGFLAGTEQRLDSGQFAYTISDDSSADKKSFAIPTEKLAENWGDSDDYNVRIKLFVAGESDPVAVVDSASIKLQPPLLDRDVTSVFWANSSGGPLGLNEVKHGDTVYLEVEALGFDINHIFTANIYDKDVNFIPFFDENDVVPSGQDISISHKSGNIWLSNPWQVVWMEDIWNPLSSEYKNPEYIFSLEDDQFDDCSSTIKIIAEDSRIDSINRWWAYAGEILGDDGDDVILDIYAGAPGKYKLDINIDEWYSIYKDWSVTDDAYVTVDGSTGKEYPFGFDIFEGFDVANGIEIDNVGSHKLYIHGLAAPENDYVVEPIDFKLVAPNGSSDVLKDIMFISDRRGLTNQKVSTFSFMDGFGNIVSNVVNSLQDLIKTYAPVMWFNAGEHYTPVSVDAVFDDSRVKLTDKNDNEVTYSYDLNHLGSIYDPNTYLDLPGSSPAEYRPGGNSTVYASVVPDNHDDPNKIAINYSFFYPYSNWKEHGGFNNHEGDWEGITVFLERNGQDVPFEPNYVGYAQHTDTLGDGGQIVNWGAAAVSETSHPIVYSGLGGHASYYDMGSTLYGIAGIGYEEPHWGDNALNLKPSDYNTVLIDRVPEILINNRTTDDWALYPGHWGEYDLDDEHWSVGDNGPRGPVFQDGVGDSGLRWYNPWGWAVNDWGSGNFDKFDVVEAGVRGDGTTLENGEWTIMSHGLSGDGYDKLIYPEFSSTVTADAYDNSWMWNMAQRIRHESINSSLDSNVAIHRVNVTANNLEDIISEGITGWNESLDVNWNNANISIGDTSYHHVLLFDWVEVSNYAPINIDIPEFPNVWYWKELLVTPPDGASGDDGYAEGSADFLYALLQGNEIADQVHSVIGYSRGGVVTSELAQRFLVDGRPETTIDQVINLDAEGGGILYEDDSFYAWTGVGDFTDNYRQKWSVTTGGMGNNLVPGSREVQADNAFGTLYSHVSFPNYFIGDPNDDSSGLFIDGGLIVTHDTPSSITDSTKNPNSLAYNPPASIFNGDFEYENSTAGWWYQGGGADDAGAGGGEVKNGKLVLDSGEHRTHNWLYVPQDARFIVFDLDEIVNPHFQASLKVKWINANNNVQEISSVSANSTENANTYRFELPNGIAGTTGKLLFRLDGGSNTTVKLDNIKWVDFYVEDQDIIIPEGGSASESAVSHGGSGILTFSVTTTPQFGTVSMNSDGDYIYTPTDEQFNGQDSFLFRAVDSLGKESNIATVIIEFTPVNDAPSFTPGNNVPPVLEDSGLYSGLWATNISAGPTDESSQNLTFDVVENGNSLLFKADHQPAIDSNGTLSFVTEENAFGTATFTVTLQDDGGTANGGEDMYELPGQFTITVEGVNDPPVVNTEPTIIPIDEDHTYNGNVTATDVDGDVLKFDADQSLNGNVEMNLDGTFTYTPNENYFGDDSFTYWANDGEYDSDPKGIFAFEIQSVNDLPVAVFDYTNL